MSARPVLALVPPMDVKREIAATFRHLGYLFEQLAEAPSTESLSSVTISQACKLLAGPGCKPVSRSAIYNAIAEGRLHPIQISEDGARRILVSELRQLQS